MMKSPPLVTLFAVSASAFSKALSIPRSGSSIAIGLARNRNAPRSAFLSTYQNRGYAASSSTQQWANSQGGPTSSVVSAGAPTKRQQKRNDGSLPVNKQSTPRSSKFSTEAAPVEVVDEEVPSFVTEHSFKDLPPYVLGSGVQQAVEKMGLSKMTEIQYRTFEELGLLGKDHADGTNVDILGRARTGTGKTIAFLLPALHHLESCGAQNLKGISVLIISPTRELATQIAQQATELIQYSKKDYAVQVMYGGTKKPADLNKISRRIPTILVATPGRLKDHLQSSSLPDKMGTFKSLFRHTKVSVLDEADHLLEMGFRKDIMAIIGYLPPKEKRQTFLFSATLPEQLKEVMAKAMKPNYKTVNCINDGSAETSLQVAQSHVILPSMNRVVISVYEILKEAQKDPNYKVIVFFPVARLVAYFEELLSDALGMEHVWGIHSRKTQGARNRVSEDFRNAKKGVLLSSDVSARGVDYPNVTHVIQCGLPDSKEQYIHRLGRTGRGGKEGKGWLVLAPFEASFVKQDLRDVDCPRDEALDAMFSERPKQEDLDFIFPGLKQVQGTSELRKTARLAYSAWLGYYLGNTKRLGMRKEGMVECANEFAKYAGLAEQPTLTPSLARKMGLAGVNGIILGQDTDEKPRRGGGGGGGGGHGGGGNRNGPSRGGGRGDNRSPSRDDRRRR